MLESAVRLREGAIPRVQKERILLSVAAERQDAYCVPLDSRILSSLGVSDVHIDALMADYRKADLSASELACLQFCLKLSRDAPSVCSGDIDALRACGFGDESIFEAVVVTALAVYRCTLSVGLGPEPDFGPRKLPGTTFDQPQSLARHGSLRDVHEAEQRKGPYVRRSLPEPQDVCTFCHRSEESWIHTELFPRSDFTARLARSGAGSSGQDSAPRGSFDPGAKGIHSAGRVGSESQLLLCCHALQPIARLRYALGGG